jgi:hypothetical protein
MKTGIGGSHAGIGSAFPTLVPAESWLGIRSLAERDGGDRLGRESTSWQLHHSVTEHPVLDRMTLLIKLTTPLDAGERSTFAFVHF